MRHFYILSLISSLVFAELKESKLEEFDLREKQIKLDSNILKNSWIDPLSITGSISKQSPNHRDESLYINLSQDIFRSGGIFYAIEYADLFENLNLLTISQERLETLYSVYILDLQIKSLQTQKERQKILIENANIDIKIKEEQYQSGIIDISSLDEAMIKANDLENSLNSIEESISTLQVQLKSLSDKDNFDVNLNIPTLKQYLNNNLIKIKEKSIDSKELIISLQRSDLLPKLTLNSNYEFTDNEYKVALNLYIPIDFDMNKKIETKRLDYLIERVKLKELLDSEELNYKNFQFKLESIEQKIKNTNAIIKRYDSLIERVDELFRGGMKTSDDLKIIKNTQKSKELDLKIFNLDRDILILNLLKNGV